MSTIKRLYGKCFGNGPWHLMLGVDEPARCGVGARFRHRQLPWGCPRARHLLEVPDIRTSSRARGRPVSDLHARLVAELDPTTPWDADRDEHVYAALRAVVELHAPVPLFEDEPDEPPVCAVGIIYCDDGGHVHHEPYPCSTIQAIARELGVDG